MTRVARAAVLLLASAGAPAQDAKGFDKVDQVIERGVGFQPRRVRPLHALQGGRAAQAMFLEELDRVKHQPRLVQ